jgi:hypothetical protein
LTTLIQRSLTGGEIAPALYARADLARYLTGARTMRNTLVMRHGGSANRPGTQFVCEVKDSTKRVKLVPFQYNVDQTYMLELGDQYLRVMRNGGQVTEAAKTVTNITRANPAVVTSTAHGFANGDEVAIAGVLGMTQVNSRNFKVANVATNTFELQYLNGTNVNSTTFTAYASGGTASRVYTITTPYLEADLSEIQFVQSADVITLTHPNYAPRNLTRTGHTAWTLSTISFSPSIAAPTGLVVNAGGTNAGVSNYVVTAIDADTREESLASTNANRTSTGTAAQPLPLAWNAVTGAGEYNVYKDLNGVFGFIGVAASNSFSDTGIIPDTQDTPPVARNPFSGTGNYPSTVGYIQQRLAFANTDNEPETTWLSRTAHFYNFTTSSPLQSDDAVTFKLAGRQVNEVRHLLDLGGLVTFTTGGEWSIAGDSAGIIRPTDINPKQDSYIGASTLPPLVLGGNALYVQARGSVVRDLAFEFQVDGYRGNDLTVFSSHLVDGYTLKDWAYQQIPHSNVWSIRDDGIALGLTYVREHEVRGWHRHDTLGLFENVAVIPEGSEDVPYFVVNRTINGATKRYIEKLASRRITTSNIKDAIFMDSALSYDGRNTDLSKTMTLSGGTTWEYTETLTLTASTSTFVAGDVGNAIHLTGADGTLIRFTMDAYTSGTVVTGKPHKTVPVSMRSVAVSSWAKAIKTVTGLWHLEGQAVSILGDGFVVGSPYNAAYELRTVTNGTITLDKPYAVIHAGLPIIADLETLNIESTQTETMADKKKNVTAVSVYLEASRGLWMGSKPPTDDSVDPLQGLTELKIRKDESGDDPIELLTDTVTINIRPEWNSNGRVFLRQVDPLPLTILAVAPAGYIPLRGGA